MSKAILLHSFTKTLIKYLAKYILHFEFAGRKATSTDIPRFSFIDSWHSFRVIIRMQIGEWVETLWDVLPYGGTTTILFYLACNLCGALLISFLLVGVVHSTVGELQSNYDPSKDRGLRLFFRKTFGLLTSPIQKIQPREMIMKNGADSSENGEDDAAKAKAEGKDGGRTKKSIVAESTSQLRQVMQDCTEHIVYKIACTSAIVIASLAMVRLDMICFKYFSFLCTNAFYKFENLQLPSFTSLNFLFRYSMISLLEAVMEPKPSYS